ncbi:hypothetical protein PHLGIDRAFT_165991 [Phlebiopsis gigantea 11061_1 CR5-6]|uniref:F-box domain-containing protein n=1 Tax=Phlebiopsis gigantea (strain 11061_1 CR5-6) TaxID=745531 RepID=A0A0C3NJK5_PHLG1|nr:hypothetical protein PHLGIDRAFT_165991 [Phlebiopsis gigantea 11061_1 CR5-6]
MLTIPGDAVSCLGSLHNLRSIKLENLGVLYDSDTVRHLAESWPALMSLVITHPHIIRTCPCMELEDVLHFVENCFNLANIAITINPIKDDSSFPPESSLPLSVASRVHFHGLGCSGNIIDKVAQFIAAVFVHSHFHLHDNPS